MNETCQIHQKLITHICKHAECLKFKPLCEDCCIKHVDQHNTMKHKQDYIITYDECCQETNQILNRIREELERTQDKATTELTIQVSSNIDEVLMEVESIRHQINLLFDRYIQGLKDKFEQKVKIKIHRVYEEIKQNIETVKDFMKSSSTLGIMMMIHQNDLDYQVQYQKSHLESLITQRVNQKFEGRIDDDIALHFIGVIQKELENLVVNQDNPKVNSKFDLTNPNPQMVKSLQQTVKTKSKGKGQFKSFATVQLDSNSNSHQLNEISIHKNQLFYFEPRTKNFHFLDVSKPKSAQILTHKLDIEFVIPVGGRAIYAEDGKIYYICGFDELCFSDEDEDHLKTIYQLDFEKKSLKPVARMVTLRNNFALVASTDQEIYIIGGENHKEGCLTKCEKLSLKNNQITIINHLTEPSSLHTCVIYHNQYIFKIGGCRINIENKRQMCSTLVYLYNIERDEWLTIDFPREVLQPSYTLLSNALQVNDHSIYVFGGITELNQVTQQAYLLLIEEDEQFDQKDNISKDLGFLFKLNYQPLKQAGFGLTQPSFINNSLIYALTSPDVKGSSWIVQVFDKKWREL